MYGACLRLQDAQELFQMVVRLVNEEAETRPGTAAGSDIGPRLKGLKLLAEVINANMQYKQ